jgi:hypothetical protein
MKKTAQNARGLAMVLTRPCTRQIRMRHFATGFRRFAMGFCGVVRDFNEFNRQLARIEEIYHAL